MFTNFLAHSQLHRVDLFLMFYLKNIYEIFGSSQPEFITTTTIMNYMDMAPVTHKTGLQDAVSDLILLPSTG